MSERLVDPEDASAALRARDWPQGVSWHALREVLRTHETGSGLHREAQAEMSRRTWSVVWMAAAIFIVILAAATALTYPTY